MRPKVKYTVIYRHRNEYLVAVMCKFFGISRSGYYDFVKRFGQREHDADLAEKIQECQNKTDKTYGYTGDHGCVIVKQGENILVIVGESTEDTKGIYDALAEKCE